MTLAPSALDLNALHYFVQIVDRRSYTAAARALGLPKSTLSRRIGELEATLGARLIQRTSRKFVVTEVGLDVYRHAQAMLEEARAVEHAVKQRLAEPAGVVRLSCAQGVAQFALSRLLPRFMERFPKIDVVLHTTNRRVDLVEEGFDLAVRAHALPLPDSSLVQRPLAHVTWALFAAPAYVERAGTPAAPADLRTHAVIVQGRDPLWRLQHAHHPTVTLPLAPRLQSDSMGVVKDLVLAGSGIAALPAYTCRLELAGGAVQRVLHEWTAGQATLTLLSPSRRGQLPSVRAFADFLMAEFPAVVSFAGISTD
ncbi:LysR substrate-binding domain-containing protein [Pendulispora albinea]|uniref:LysR substrate-binding domain-containing protein n=1 Tax=Pendulispora albinea TaxID=2741071 RepID=A0ABZ2M0G9_9BACT